MNDDIRFCTECGARLDNTSVFCPVCGTKVSDENQRPPSNLPPPNQINQGWDNNYYNQPGNAPSYPSNYNNYTPPQYVSPKKKANTPLIIILVILGVLALAAGAYFGIKLLQGNTGTSANPSDTKTSDTKTVTTDEDITGVWEGTVTLTEAKDIDDSSGSPNMTDLLNKPLKTKLEIVPGSKSTGEMTMYLAEDVGEDPSPYGLALTYEFRNGELKAEMQENGSSFSIDFKLGNKNGILQFKGTMSISAPQSNGKIGHVKGNVDIKRTSKKVSSSGSGSKESTAQQDTGGQDTKPSDNGGGSSGEDTGILQYIEDPTVYLPKPNMRYTYKNWWQDGSTGTEDIVAGVIPGFSIVTAVDIIDQSEPYTQHFVDGADGIYVFADDEYNQYSSLWLPYNAKAGDSWDEEGVSIKIVQLEASCDIDNMSFKDCIVLEVNYTDAGVSYTSYLAPGMGTVLMNDKDTGNARMKLLNAVPISEQEANNIVQQYSPNAMAVLED